MTILPHARLEFTRGENALVVAGRRHKFPEKQFEALWRLAEVPGRILSPYDLLGFDRKPGSESARKQARRTARARISRIRGNLGPDQELVETRWGIGYCLDLDWSPIS